MANKGNHKSLSATVPGPRPGDYPLGSLQSRAAARAMLEARKRREGPWVVSIEDLARENLDGLAERIVAERGPQPNTQPETPEHHKPPQSER
jgi:hypothetical protein